MFGDFAADADPVSVGVVALTGARVAISIDMASASCRLDRRLTGLRRRRFRAGWPVSRVRHFAQFDARMLAGGTR